MGEEGSENDPGDRFPRRKREALIEANALDALFSRLDRAISEAGYLPMGGQIVDATLVAAPRQRNTEAERNRIKAGETSADIWPESPAKARQKDVDARWTVKFSKAKPKEDVTPQIDIAIPTFGYSERVNAIGSREAANAYQHRQAARDHPQGPDYRRGGA